jgi:hypothetical protein
MGALGGWFLCFFFRSSGISLFIFAHSGFPFFCIITIFTTLDLLFFQKVYRNDLFSVLCGVEEGESQAVRINVNSSVNRSYCTYSSTLFYNTCSNPNP